MIPSPSGKRSSLVFFLLPSFWGFGDKGGTDLKSWLSTVPIKESPNEDVDIQEERHLTVDAKNDAVVRIVGLRKEYRNNLCIKSKNDKVAVKNLTLSLQEGSL